MGGIIIILGWILLTRRSDNQDDLTGIESQPSGRSDEEIQEDEADWDANAADNLDEEQDDENQEDKQGSVSTGQRIEYNPDGEGKPCDYVIDEILDEDSRLFGHFEVEVPAGASVISLHFDRANLDIYLTYRLGDEAFETYVNVGEIPEALDDWDEVLVDYVVAKQAKPAKATDQAQV